MDIRGALNSHAGRGSDGISVASNTRAVTVQPDSPKSGKSQADDLK
jgi:hypothetical protein